MAEETEGVGAPEGLYCVITEKLMDYPVIGPDGYTYEKAAIEEWLSRNNTSPMTRQEMRIEDLVPNRALADVLEAYRGKVDQNIEPLINRRRRVQESDGSVVLLDPSSQRGSSLAMGIKMKPSGDMCVSANFNLYRVLRALCGARTNPN